MLRSSVCVRLAIIGAAALLASCSLGNVSHDACETASECVAAFGFGSTCEEGYCKDAPACTVPADCRSVYGYGVTCESGRCALPTPDPRCTLTEPPELVDQLNAPITDRILLGSIFKLDTEKEKARATAAVLAVREINEVADGIAGQKLGLVVCNNDSDAEAPGGGSANDAEETAALTLYLARDVGVSAIVGPSSSSNTQVATNTITENHLPTVVITPSGTSISLTDLPDRLVQTDPFGLLWRTCPSDVFQGKVLAQLIDDLSTSSQKVAVIYQKDAYGSGLEDVFRNEFKGGTIDALPFDIDPAETLEQRIQGVVAEAAGETPDVVLVISGDASRTVLALTAIGGQIGFETTPIYLTDGSKDAGILLGEPAIDGVLDRVKGTAPGADPARATFGTFASSLGTEFQIGATDFSFLAHTYDAAFVAAYGIVYANAKAPASFTGLDVAEGLSRLSAGTDVDVGPTDFNSAVSGLQGGSKQINVIGASGDLDFVPSVGEAPGTMEVWKPNAAKDGFVTAPEGFITP